MLHPIFKLFVLLALLFLAITSEALSPTEKLELSKWGNRLAASHGTLLTPPKGAIQSDVEAIQRIVESIVETLAGPELRARKANFVVNIYSSDIVNAFAFDQPADRFGEEEWAKTHKGKIWPIRKFHGFADNQRPIIEFGLTLGLIRELPNIDALAFVMGHEICHYLESHTHHYDDRGQIAKKYWNSQAFETIADYCGILKMKGKYNLDGAMQALYSLMASHNNEKFELLEAIEAGMGSHHSEGPRITSAQANIDHILRNNEDARRANYQVFPMEVARGLGRIPGRSRDNYLQTLPGFLKGLDDYLLQGKRHPAIGRARVVREDLADFHHFFYWSKEFFPETIDTLLEKLNQSNSSGSVKVNTLFSVLLGYHRESRYDLKASMDTLSSEQIYDLSQLLVQSTKGKEAWKKSDFKKFARYSKGIERFIYNERNLPNALFLNSPNLLFVLYRAAKVNPYWRGVMRELLSIKGYVSTKSIDLESIYNHIELIQIYKDVPELYATAQVQLFNELEDLNSELLLKNIHSQYNLQTFYFLWLRLKKADALFDLDPSHPNYHSRLRDHQLMTAYYGKLAKIFENTSRLFEATAIEQFVAAAADPTMDRELVFSFWDSASRIADATAPDDPRRTDLLGAVATLFKISQEKMDLHPFGSYPSISGYQAHQLSTLLIAKDTDKVLKRFLFKSLGAYGEVKDEAWSQKVQSDIDLYLSQLAPKEIMATLAAPFVPYAEKTAHWANQVKLQIRSSWGRRRVSGGPDLFKSYRADVAQEYGENADLRMSDLAVAEFNVLSFSLRNLKRSGASLPIATGDELIAFIKLVDQSRLKLIKIKAITYYDPKTEKIYLNKDGYELIIESFFNVLPQLNMDQILFSLDRMQRFGNFNFSLTPFYKLEISKVISNHLNELSVSKSRQWLQNEKIRSTLNNSDLSDLLYSQVIKSVTTRNIDYLRQQVDYVENKLGIKNKFPEVYRDFKNRIAKHYNIQPHELYQVFPRDERTDTEKIVHLANEIRGASALTEMIRGQSTQDQLDMIEFLMGRSSAVPKFVHDVEAEIYRSSQGKMSIINLIIDIAGEMKIRTSFERAFLVNSILAGPTGLLHRDGGLEALKAQFLSLFDESDRVFAQKVINGMIKAEGEYVSMAFSYCLAQKNKNGGSLSKTDFFKALLEMRGVPGVKFGQYLAFTNDFEEYQDSLASFQDAAMPLTYFEVIELIIERFGADWPKHYAIKKIIGSGSVNVAVTFVDLNTGEEIEEVLNIARSNIEARTREDFHRFSLFLHALVEDDDSGSFDFALGLLDLIQASVELEFNKAESYRMQNNAYVLNGGQLSRGWRIRSVKAHDYRNMSIFMEKAQGKPAKNVLVDAPEVYNESMAALIEVEFNHLMGIKLTNEGYFMANPDLHNGQIFIDEDKREVTVIDYGQAVELDDTQRRLALDLLRLISSDVSRADVTRMMKRWAQLYGLEYTPMTKKEFDNVFAKKDRMDRFIKLISRLNLQGFQVPLASVHWIFAANRLIALGNKVGIDVEFKFKAAVGAQVVAGDAGFGTLQKLSGLWERAELLVDEGISATNGLIEDVLSGTHVEYQNIDSLNPKDLTLCSSHLQYSLN